MNKEKLTQVKRKKKSQNPVFIRQDTHKKKRLSKIWRKSRGGDSKNRLRMQNRRIVHPGYGTPTELKHFHKSGLLEMRVSSIEDAEKLNHKEHGAILDGKIGLRKKINVIEALIKNKITILNILNPGEYIKDKKAQLETKKKEKPETKKEVKKEDKSIDDKLSDEEKKKLEKKEIDKLLTKKV